jgi:hypothetical protein
LGRNAAAGAVLILLNKALCALASEARINHRGGGDADQKGTTEAIWWNLETVPLAHLAFRYSEDSGVVAHDGNRRRGH